VRALGGVNAEYPIGSVAKPFAELSVEETGGTLGLRVTPGVVITPGEHAPRILAAVDIAPIAYGAADAAPAEPLATARLSVSWAFGAKPHGSRPIGELRPRGGPKMTVFVHDEAGVGIKDLTIQIKETIGKLPVPREILKRTDGNGRVTFPASNVVAVKIRETGGFSEVKTSLPAPGEPVDLLYIALGSVPMKIDLVDEKNLPVREAHLLVTHAGRSMERSLNNLVNGRLETSFPSDSNVHITVGAIPWEMMLDRNSPPAPKKLTFDSLKNAVRLVMQAKVATERTTWKSPM